MAGEKPEIYDILIVGGGPSGLAVASRLCESTPSALFTESEHQRYYWMKHNTQANRNKKPQKFSRRSGTAPDRLLTGAGCCINQRGQGLRMAVLDASSEKWMGAWNGRFRDLRISHLRSPMFFHPDPRDRDGMLAYVYRLGREKELKEIKDVIGLALSKHQRKSKSKSKKNKQPGRPQQEITYLDERERNDFFRPSQAVFKDYCEDIVTRYGLSDLVEKSEVQHITYDAAPASSSSGLFTLQTSTGTKRAKIVVFAVGPATVTPSLPKDCPFYGMEDHGSVKHVFAAGAEGKTCLPELLKERIRARKRTNVVVVGGGLTSAQAADVAIREGVSKVWLCMRGYMKVKHFDVDLEWVSKYRNVQSATFWSADDDEARLEMINQARNGGSITPEYKKILQKHTSSSYCSVHEHTSITSAEWCSTSHTWTLKTNNSELQDLPPIDHIIYATGLPVDFSQISCIKELCENVGLETVGGYPVLTNDLMMAKDVPFFVTGRLAGLRLGPWAGNLEGARTGAERVAWGVEQVVRAWCTCEGSDSGYEGSESEEVDMRRLGLGRENQFAVLGEDGLEE